MTAPGEGGESEDAVAWVGVAASAAGLVSEFEKIGREASSKFSAAFKQGLGGDGLSDLSEHLSGATSNMERLGVVAGATGGLVVAGAEMASEGLEGLLDVSKELVKGLYEIGETWEGVSRKLEATTTATGADLESLKDTIGDVSAHTAASFDTITAATAVLAQRTGLRGGALGQLVTDFTDAGQMLGKAIDPAAFAATARALQVPADQMDAYFNRLFDVSRQSGVGMDQLVESLHSSGAVLSAFGIGADQAAQLVAGLAAAGIKDSTVLRGMTPLVKEAAREHESLGAALQNVVQHMADAHLAGDAGTEAGWAKKLGTRGAIAFTEAINSGTLSLDTFRQSLSDLPTDSVSEVYDRTATLSDKISELGHSVNVELEPIGEAITANLGGAFSKLSDWVSTHGGDIVGWLGEVGDVGIAAFGQLETGLGDVVSGFGQLEIGVGMVTGDDGLVKAGRQAQTLGDSMTTAGQHVGDTTKKFDDFIARTRASVTVSENLTAALKLASDGKGIELKDNSPEVRQHLADLKKAGVDVTTGPDGELHFSVDNAENQKRVAEFLHTLTGHEVDVPVVPTVVPPGSAPPPPPPPGGVLARQGSTGGTDSTQTFDGGTIRPGSVLDWFANHKDELMMGPRTDTPTPTPSPRDFHPGRAAPSGYTTEIPAQIAIQPAANRTDLRDVLDSAGIPDRVRSSDNSGVTFPTGMDVRTADPLDPADLMSKAGVPEHFQGDVIGASPGVLLPTGLDVRDAPTKSVGELMESIGIPSEQQGPDGVLLNVDYAQGTSTAGTVPAGSSGGAGGPVTGPGSASQAGYARAIYENAISQGYSPQTGQYLVAASLLESGINPDITNASGHHGLFQESADKPSAGAAQQLQWVFDELRRQGGPGAVNAYPGGPGAFIADKIEVGGYPGSDYDKFIPQAQTLIGQTPPAAGGAPGAVPAGYSGEGPSGGMPGASISYTPDWLLQHGIRPIFEKNPNDPGGAATPGEIPAWVTQLGAQFNLTPKDHGDHTLHGGLAGPGNTVDKDASWAFDFFGAADNMQKFADYLSTNYAGQLVQLIHQDPATGRDTGVAGGQRLGQGQYYTSAGGSYSDESDEVHVAFASPVGAAGGSGFPMAQNAGWTVGGQPGIVDVDRVTRDNGNPQTPQPVAPGSSFNAVPPPPDFPTVPDGTDKSVKTPWGSFVHTFDMDPAQQQLLTPEQRSKYDSWLNAYTASLEAATDSQDEVNRAQERVDKALKRKTDADDSALPGDPDSTNAAASADHEYTDAVSDLAKAKRHAIDEQNRANTEAEKPAPWETDSSKASSSKPDRNAEDLGKGLVKGIFQEFGFPDVFGKPLSEWGIVKMLTGGAGYGLGLLQNMGQKPTGLYAPGGPLAALAGQTPGGSTSTTGGTDSAGASVLEGIVPGLTNLMHPTQGTPAAAAWQGPGGAPTPPAATAAGVGTAVAPIIPASYGGPGTTQHTALTVQNTYQGFNPTPQVKDQIRTVANYTSAPAMSGGAGIPI